MGGKQAHRDRDTIRTYWSSIYEERNSRWGWGAAGAGHYPCLLGLLVSFVVVSSSSPLLDSAVMTQENFPEVEKKDRNLEEYDGVVSRSQARIEC